MIEMLKEMLVNKLAGYLPGLLQMVALGALGMLIRFLKKKTDLVVLQALYVEIEETAAPHIKHFFDNFSKDILEKAADGKFTKEEKKQLLLDVGKRAREEYECAYKEIMAKGEKLLPNFSAFLDGKLEELYQDVKAAFQEG